MVPDGVIRSDAPHEVKLPAGVNAATSVQPTREFGDSRREQSTQEGVRVPQAGGVQWAEFEDAVNPPRQDEWAVRPARVTHVGRPAAKRVDFRGPLKALRAKNAEVRDRLNQLMAPTRQVMK